MDSENKTFENAAIEESKKAPNKKLEKSSSSSLAPTATVKNKNKKSPTVKSNLGKKAVKTANVNDNKNIDQTTNLCEKKAKKRPKTNSNTKADNCVNLNGTTKAKKPKSDKKEILVNDTVINNKSTANPGSHRKSTKNKEGKEFKNSIKRKISPIKEKKNKPSTVAVGKKNNDVVINSHNNTSHPVDVKKNAGPPSDLLEQLMSIVEQQQHSEQKQNTQQYKSSTPTLSSNLENNARDEIDTQTCFVYG